MDLIFRRPWFFSCKRLLYFRWVLRTSFVHCARARLCRGDSIWVWRLLDPSLPVDDLTGWLQCFHGMKLHENQWWYDGTVSEFHLRSFILWLSYWFRSVYTWCNWNLICLECDLLLLVDILASFSPNLRNSSNMLDEFFIFRPWYN